MNKTAKAISAVTILLLISKPLGFLREMTVAAYYGATSQTDAYNMAVNIISLSSAVISAGIAAVIIPAYNHKLLQKNKDEADSFANNILWITSLFYVLISIAGIIFAPALIKIFAPKFDAETTALTVKILRIIFIFTVFINISNYMSSVAKIYNKFNVTVIAGYFFTALTVVFTVFFAKYIGVYALVLSYILFLLIQVLILIFSLRKVFKFKAVLNFTDGGLKEIIKLSAPVYVSVAVWEINSVINRIFASGLIEGSISAMDYADRLRGLPDGIITSAVITVMFPLLSQYAAKKDFYNLKSAAVKTVSLLFCALSPIITVSLYYAREITRTVYERGAFTPDKTELTANIFIFAVISLAFSGGAVLLSNTFYSMRDTKSPRTAAIIMIACNIILNFIFVRYMRAAGLALATSIAFFIYFIILLVKFRLKYGPFGGFALLKNIIKYIIAASGMIPVFFLCELLRGRLPVILFLTVSAVISMCVYALLLYLFKAELFIYMLNRTKIYILNFLGN